MSPGYLSGMLNWPQLSLSDNVLSVADETQAQRMMMEAILETAWTIISAGPNICDFKSRY